MFRKSKVIQKSMVSILIAVGVAIPSVTQGAGFVYNENFTVFTPSEPSPQAGQKFAERVLARAERYRKAIATEWLGDELPPSVGRTIISVCFSESKERGLTWAKDNPRRK